jgi:positive regulator of sigma E activity
MSKYYKFIEIAYLLVAIFFIVETFLNWSDNREKAYIYLAFSAVAVFMFFFKKKFRKKFEDSNK